jgi:hypothetical protein
MRRARRSYVGVSVGVRVVCAAEVGAFVLGVVVLHSPRCFACACTRAYACGFAIHMREADTLRRQQRRRAQRRRAKRRRAQRHRAACHPYDRSVFIPTRKQACESG